MSKKHASKTTKLLINESEIKSKGLDKSDFTTSWKGRIGVINPEKSMIAKKVKIEEVGQYAIKVR